MFVALCILSPPRLISGAEATKILGTTSKKFTHLYRSDAVVQLSRGGGERNAFATYDANDLAASGVEFRDKLRAVIGASRLGVTANGLEQLICLQAIKEICDERVRAVCAGRQVSSSAFESFIGRLKDAASDEKDLIVPAYNALGAIGGRSKPYGPLLVAMADGRVPFAMRPGEGPLLGRVQFTERDAADIADFQFEEDRYPDFDFATTITRIDAIDVLNVTPPMMMVALKTELAGLAADRLRLQRDGVLAIAAARIAGGEIRHRWMGGRRIVPKPLKPGGRIPRLDILGWSRPCVESLMVGE